MKKILLTLSIAILAVSATFAQNMKIDAEKATVKFNFVSEKTTGSLTGLKAEIDFNAADPSKSTISGSIDVSTLTTGNGMRDKHLQSNDAEEGMFMPEEFPTIDFTSTSIEKKDGVYIMKGKITIKGTTKEIDMPFTFADNVFEAKMVMYTNDFNVFVKDKHDDSKVLVKITIPVL